MGARGWPSRPPSDDSGGVLESPVGREQLQPRQPAAGQQVGCEVQGIERAERGLRRHIRAKPGCCGP